MKMPGSTVSTGCSINGCNTKDYLQQSTAKQCQQQDKKEGTSSTTESAYDTACRLTLNDSSHGVMSEPEQFESLKGRQFPKRVIRQRSRSQYGGPLGQLCQSQPCCPVQSIHKTVLSVTDQVSRANRALNDSCVTKRALMLPAQGQTLILMHAFCNEPLIQPLVASKVTEFDSLCNVQSKAPTMCTQRPAATKCPAHSAVCNSCCCATPGLHFTTPSHHSYHSLRLLTHVCAHSSLQPAACMSHRDPQAASLAVIASQLPAWHLLLHSCQPGIYCFTAASLASTASQLPAWHLLLHSCQPVRPSIASQQRQRGTAPRQRSWHQRAAGPLLSPPPR